MHFFKLLALAFNCLFAVFCAGFSGFATADEHQFPLRAKYHNVQTISVGSLADKFDNTVIVDVRSRFEYGILRIAGAINIPISNKGFMPELKALRAKNDHSIIFYCNGITCEKSYQASIAATKANITKVLTFDSGIQAWAQLHPESTLLFGNPLGSKDNLISNEKFAEHVLSPQAFLSAIGPKSFVIDIREPFQRDIKILQNIAIVEPLDVLKNVLKRYKKTKKTLFIFDAVGKQVRWLQYLIEKEGIEQYYFMQGGVAQYRVDVQ